VQPLRISKKLKKTLRIYYSVYENSKEMAMKQIKICSMLALFLLAGCIGQNTELSRLNNSVKGYNATLSLLIHFRMEGKIDDKLFLEIDKWRVAARAGLNQWRSEIDSGIENPAGATMYRTAIDKLIAIKLGLEKEHGPDSDSGDNRPTN